MTHALRVAPEVIFRQVEATVWGAYNPDSGETLFLDALDWQLLETFKRTSNPSLVSNVIAGALRDDLAVPGLIGQKIQSLKDFGALVALPTARPSVLLIDPPCPLNMVGTRGPAKGLCYLAAALQSSLGVRSGILDMRSVSPELGSSEIAHFSYLARHAPAVEPRVVGITAVSATIVTALAIARAAKVLFPDALVVLGGPHVSYAWQAVMATTDVDVVVVGEAEVSFPELVRRVLGGKGADLSGIPGVVWRKGDSIEFQGWSPAVECLDDITMPDDREFLLNHEDYEIEHGRVLSARGCTFKCSFCSTASFTGRKVRVRSVSEIVREIAYYHERYGMQSWAFDDDIFTINKKRTLELCRAIEEFGSGRQLSWGCNTRMDCIDDDIIAALYRAGCRFVLFGIESGSPDVQQRFGKGKRSLQGFRSKISRMLELGMQPQLNFILGLPGESPESVGLIEELIDDLGASVSCTFNFLNVFPGTPLERDMKNLGITYRGKSDRERYSVSLPTVDVPGMSAEQQTDAFFRLMLFWRRQEERNSSRAETEPLGPAIAS